MKTILQFLVSLLLLSGCASAPPKRTPMIPPPQVIHIVSEQRILHFNKDPRVYYLFAVGAYRLTAEDKYACFYTNETGEFRYKYLKPETVMKGGLAYSKSTGNFFIFWAEDEDEVRKNARMKGTGEILLLGVKSTTGDKTFRGSMTWVSQEFVDQWKLE